MDPNTRVVGLDAQGNMVFTVVKPVMGIFQVASEQTGNVAHGSMGLQGLSENTLILPQIQGQLDQNQMEMHHLQPHIQMPQMQVSAPEQTRLCPRIRTRLQTQAQIQNLQPTCLLLRCRKYLISYDEIKRRLQAPEKMSLRSLAAYTRVSRGPASKKTLLESLNVLGLTPSTTTSVSSSFSKLTEGDTDLLRMCKCAVANKKAKDLTVV
ncbi:hypothetical protein F7725_014521 [Dissostichus mawsoni]|uniref:Uncharacterized protein n=1 Tax=Dissostichus mawsoni TaxID=36200 RepID=A0A7J5YX94_DISMA|nr:hypothetical protein F7725_014521 [Dissostichus mawsoni]